jgi:iron-sulfur cluster assembly accessory protein
MNIDDAALKKAILLKDNESDGELFLRITVQAGGCAGLRYGLFFDNMINPDDRSYKHTLKSGESLLLVTDKMSAPYLEGATINYYDSLERSGFVIDNPNAKGSCSCGDSFS